MPRGQAYHQTITLGAVGDEADRSEGITYHVIPVMAATEDIMVSAVRMVTNGTHAYLTVFNGGANAGTLTVRHEHRNGLIARLFRVRLQDLPRSGTQGEARIMTK